MKNSTSIHRGSASTNTCWLNAHILSFVYLAYATMALLYETVPAFEDTWIGCLADLPTSIKNEKLYLRVLWMESFFNFDNELFGRC